FLQKGRRAFVEGRLQTRSWDGPDGQRRYKTEIVASTVLFLDRPQAAPMSAPPDFEATTEPDDLPFE
ncbi:MAG TPA: single-stranded DNA-binding protein, partial [Dehalococcoidia bacterium]|nr:single-stranded DNA-binding protein [Dehalococcoidia bacterium]